MSARVEAVDPADWEPLLAELDVSDVYYSRGFVEASAIVAEGSPTLLAARGPGGAVIFPCLVREDPCDVVTPYGYGGPLAVGPSPPAGEFPAAYQRWCEERGAISTFAVYHPLFANHASPAAAGFRRAPLADTVAWPLDAPDLLAPMHAHHRRLVRRAQREGLVATIEPEPPDLVGFLALYEETMRRAAAASFYYFEPAYWERLLADVPLVRADVHRDRELVASVLGMGRAPWLHYHLGGSTPDGRRLGASHLALFTLASWGREHGYDRLHLGGGVGGQVDSLHLFKTRFAPNRLVSAQIGKAVHDESAYLRLSEAAAIDWDGFFPAYREPRLTGSENRRASP